RWRVPAEGLERRVGAIESPADAERVWGELAADYSRSARMNAEAVRELKSLLPDRVDPAAVECVAELADFLAFQADLLRRSGEDCRDMAALLAMIRAEGD